VSQAHTLQDLLAGFAARGDAPAVIAFTAAGAAATSFAALHRDAFALARALAQRGIGPGATVAVTGPNGAPWITAFWGAVAVGATVLALDAQLGDEDATRMLEAAEARLAFAPSARKLGIETIALDRPLPRAEGPAPPQRAKPDDRALLLFTSGTTGNPKGVPLTNANLLSNVNALAAAGVAGPGDRALLPLPLHHAYPLTVGMLTAFAVGAALVLPAGVSGPELLAALRDGCASVLMGVPRLYTALAAGIRQRVAARAKPVRRLFALMLALARRTGTGRLLFRSVRGPFAPALRLLVSGGAKLDGEVESFLAALGWEVLTGYGLTETSPILAFNRPDAGKPGSAGRPLEGIELRIANADADGVGEIEAKGASVFQGYLADAAATQRAFTADGFFRTADFGHIDRDGFLHIAARVAETIVLADGKKLFPEATESAYAAHPFVKEIALFAREGALAALVVPDLEALREAGAAQLRTAIRDALGERGRGLPSHARVTGFALARESLPRTQLGKIRRHLIPPLYEQALQGREPTAPAPLSAEDEALLQDPAAAAVWGWLKARFPDHGIGLDMSPQLDLGIDSLGWVDLTLALERDHGVSLTEQEIGRIVTVRDLLRAAVAARGRPAEPQAAATLPRLGAWWLALRAGVALVRVVMRAGFKLRVDGVELLPAAGPFLVCPNHESYLDPVAMAAALPPRRIAQTWWAGWTGILHTTWLRRRFSRIAQIVPVDQYRGGGASLALAAQVFERGHALVWFPEGALTRSGKIERFQAGVGVLVARHKVPVVPVRIDGSYECWPVDSKFRGFHPIRVSFGKPLDPAALIAASDGDPQRIADAIHDAVAALDPSPTLRAGEGETAKMPR
jgi:long-chain acyl-CoA synthetase